MFGADALCDRIAVIARGSLVGEGTPQALKARVAHRTVVEIETYGIGEEEIGRVRSMEGVASVSVEERDQAQLLLVQSPDGLEMTGRLLSALNGVRVGRVASREPTLEDAYVALVTEEAQ
jgi:ABC-2 type transport system ATP-binding protein